MNMAAARRRGTSFIAAILLLMALVAALRPLSASAAEADWKYEIMRDGASGEQYVQILQYQGPDVDVPVVPATIEGIPVTHVYYYVPTLSPSPISSLDISRAVHLRELNCVGYGLQEIDFSNNPELEVLNVARNNLVSLDLSHNPNLRELDCDHNALTSLDISSNSKLVRLICNDNAIEDLSSLESWASGEGRYATLMPQNLPDDSSERRLFEVGGADRYEVSQMTINQALGDEKGPYHGVVVVSGEDGKFTDALSANALAGLLNYPVLLVHGDALSFENREALKWLRNSLGGDRYDLEIIVVGGPDSVSENVLAQMGAEYGVVSTRLGGIDRYEVSRRVYDYGQTRGDWSDDVVFVAKGNDFPDALSIAPYASSHASPVLLVDQNDTVLSPSLRDRLSRHREAVVLGGERSITTSLFDQIDALMPNGATRLGGVDRFEASRNIVNWELSNGMTLQGVGFSTGHKFTDALSSGFFLGLNDSVLLLVDGDSVAANADLLSLLRKAQGEITRAYIFGGPASVPESLRLALIQSLGGEWVRS